MDNPVFTAAPELDNNSDSMLQEEKGTVELQNYEKEKKTNGNIDYPNISNIESQSTDKEKTTDEFEPPEGGNVVGNVLLRLRTNISKAKKTHHIAVHRGIILFLHLCVIAYVIGATYYWFIHGGGADGENIDFCDGLGMVYVLAGILYLGLFYFQILKPYFGRMINKIVLKPSNKVFDKFWAARIRRLATYTLLLGALILFLVLDTATERRRLVSVSGVIVLIGLGFIFSKYPGHIRWRPVIWGLTLQFIFGLLTIRWKFGQSVLQCIGDKVTTFLSYTDKGTVMVYGDYLINTLQVFAFKVLPVIFFFSFCIQILYYYGVMQWIVLKLGWMLQVTLGTTVCESVNTAASIFLGQSEAPLIIRPYIPLLTRSELHAIMTGGFATIAGTVMAAYLSFGVDASHLITASVMSAPAALCYSKLFYPEVEKSQTTTSDIKITKGDETSALDAAAKGANDGISLVLGIIANLIAFIAFIEFLNGAISWFSMQLGAPYITFEWILSKVFIPLAFVMGVVWEDCPEVATLIGLKTVVNEFVAYERLGEMIANNEISERSAAIATYALCGFSNPGSIGIMIGALSNMAPNKRKEITEVAFSAFIAGSAACFLTACIAGILISSDSLEPFTTTPLPTINTTLMF